MARVFRTQTGSQQRSKLMKQIALTLRRGADGGGGVDEQKDMFAYMILCLREIGESVDVSATAWEKRGYWVKADRFRGEWSWAANIAEQLEQALRREDMVSCIGEAAKLSSRLGAVKVGRSGQSTPWQGAWNQLGSPPGE